MVFMALSWGAVLALTARAFIRILKHQQHFDPDGIGPASPPEPGQFDEEGEIDADP